MFELFVMGGIQFMTALTIMFLAALWFAVRAASGIFSKGQRADQVNTKLEYIRFFGLLALVSGILGQMIGLYSAFIAIEEMGQVSQAMLAGGVKVSSITTIYGLIIFVITRLLWFGLHYKASK